MRPTNRSSGLPLRYCLGLDGPSRPPSLEGRAPFLSSSQAFDLQDPGSAPSIHEDAALVPVGGPHLRAIGLEISDLFWLAWFGKVDDRRACLPPRDHEFAGSR